jgi:formate hydrogenlyase subunit 6/NADH:ubiquinone oxidoreductase subunit I
MPWVDKNLCSGCGICVEQCPADAIFLDEVYADIKMDNCIHCGLCHESCPENAIKHDSEKIPAEVEANIIKTKEFMDACARLLGREEEKQKCLKRMIKHFTKEKVVMEKTLNRLKKLQN